MPGSGLRVLGAALTERGTPVDADILLSHTHFDHICGLPFFAAMFDPKARIRFWAGHLPPPTGIAAALSLSWQPPLLPDMNAEFHAHTEFRDFVAGDDVQLQPDLVVGTVALRHPGNAVGYRINWQGSSVCYITDTEHPADGLDQNLQKFVAGTDVMIYDASYTEAEHQSRLGWGHSTWQAGVRLADAGAVGTLVLFHHDPAHDDTTMDQIAAAVAKRRPGTLVAMEGMEMAVEATATTPPAARPPR